MSALLGYPDLLRRHPRPIAFGFLCAVASCFGQTFFISLFAEDIDRDLGVSRTTFSTLYGVCTLVGAFLMPWLGRGIDRLDLRRYAAVCMGALAAGCFAMAFVREGLEPAWLLLAPAVLVVRGAGQGLMTHIEVTSVSRFFTRSRGKALALASLGHPAGEGTFPLLFTALSAAVGWQSAWAMASGAMVLALVVGAWLLRGLPTQPEAYRAADDDGADRAAVAPPGRSWTRREVFTHLGFLALLPYWLAPAFVLTGTFFHQLTLSSEMGWDKAWLAQSFLAFAGMRTVIVLAAGPLIDRLGPRRLAPFTLSPLLLGLLPLPFVTGPAWAPLYLGLSGATVGLSSVLASWLAGRFGTLHLGSIRSGLFALVVLSTSVSPPLFGVLLDAGITMKQLVLGSVSYMLASTVLAVLGFRALDRARGGA